MAGEGADAEVEDEAEADEVALVLWTTCVEAGGRLNCPSERSC